jgi:mRNA-degrading endonuclease toxin of MazEF toxin-antitoxin module
MKDFDSWNTQKKKLEEINPTLHFHEREIWWCSLGLNVGDEQDGRNNLFERPVLVFKKFNGRICLVIPMSSKIKPGPYYHHFKFNKKVFSLSLSQLRLISIKRFRRFIGKISSDEFSIIKNKCLDIISP